MLGGGSATVEVDANTVRMFRADHAACTWPELDESEDALAAELATERGDLDAFLERVEGTAVAERVIH